MSLVASMALLLACVHWLAEVREIIQYRSVQGVVVSWREPTLYPVPSEGEITYSYEYEGRYYVGHYPRPRDPIICQPQATTELPHLTDRPIYLLVNEEQPEVSLVELRINPLWAVIVILLLPLALEKVIWQPFSRPRAQYNSGGCALARRASLGSVYLSHAILAMTALVLLGIIGWISSELLPWSDRHGNRIVLWTIFFFAGAIPALSRTWLLKHPQHISRADGRISRLHYVRTKMLARFGLIVIAASWIAVVCDYLFVPQKGRGVNYERADGRIIVSEYNPRRVRGERQRLVYEYEVNGYSYQGDRVSFCGGGTTRGDVEKYPRGATVVVYFDPHDPIHCALTGGDKDCASNNNAISLCVLLTVGYIAVRYALTRNRRLRSLEGVH